MERRHRNALPKGYRVHWYEIDSILGQGGFGITYLARDTNLDQLVAIKEFLPQELAVREEDSSVHPVTDGHADTFGWGLSRFLSEARTLAKFRHPNIVLVHSVFEANNTAYMVMEYEHGRSLDDALKFRKIEGEAQLKAMVWPLLDGLELMHEAGFIHRDIKPGNIFIREDGTPVLLDFGSARLALGGQTRTLTTLVSPGYAPFEQYETSSEGGRQGPWTDLYSLAATLYMAVTGKGPPDAVTRANARLENRPDPLIPSSVAAPSGFSPGFLYAIDAALAFQASERPKNVSQWRHLLEATEAQDFDAESTVIRGPANDTAPVDTSPRVTGADTGGAIRNADSRGADARRRSPARPVAKQATQESRGGRRGLALFLVLALVGALAAGGWYTRELWMKPAEPPVAVVVTSEPAITAPTTEAAQPAPTATSAEATSADSAQAEAKRASQETALDTLRESPQAAASELADTGASETATGSPVSPTQARITELLGAAEVDMRAGRLVEPADASALYRFHDVLALEADNQRARDGLQRIAEALAAEAAIALAGGQVDEAERKLMQAEVVDPSAADVVQLRARLEDTRAALRAAREVDRQRAEEQARQAAEAERAAAEEEARRAEQARLAAEAEAKRAAEAEARRIAAADAEAKRAAEQAARQAQATPAARVAELLAAAAVDLEATRLTSPTGANAFEKYQQVSRLDPGNAEANVGRQRIVERYLELAEAAVLGERFEQAESYLRRAESVTPGSELVAASRAAVAAASARATAPAVQVAPEPTPVPAPEPEPEPPPVVATVAPSAPAAPVTPTPPPAPKLRLPAHVAIAPIETKRNCYESDDVEVRDAVVSKTSEAPELTLVFDAYTESSRSAIAQSIWQGSRVERVPVFDEAARLADQYDADIVFLGFIDCGHTPQANRDRFLFKLWAFDVNTGEKVVQEGRMSDFSGGVRLLLDNAIASRRGR